MYNLSLNCFVSRNTENNTYEPTTWQIIFEHQYDLMSGNYTLQLALASAADAYLQVHHYLFLINLVFATLGLNIQSH